jgi:hypothetical protein
MSRNLVGSALAPVFFIIAIPDELNLEPKLAVEGKTKVNISGHGKSSWENEFLRDGVDLGSLLISNLASWLPGKSEYHRNGGR